MAGEARRLIALALAAAAVGAAAGPGPVQALAGSYRNHDGHAEIIPVDARHAYVHLYFRFGLLHDKICEFEEVATAEGDALFYENPPGAEDDAPCAIRFRRDRAKLAWSASDLSCTRYCPNRSLADGDLPWSSRRPVKRSQLLTGEGTRGYDDTVKAWRPAT